MILYRGERTKKTKFNVSELSSEEIESVKANSDIDRVKRYSEVKIDTPIYAFKQRKTGNGIFQTVAIE